MSAAPVLGAQLANGLRVLVVERHALPHVAIAYVSLRGGEDNRELDDAGLASLVATALVTPSDEDLSAEDIDPAAAPTSPSAGSGGAPAQLPLPPFMATTLRHTSSIGAFVEQRDFTRAMQALSGLVRHPTLDERVLNRAKVRVRGSWDGERFDAAGIARNHVMQRIYGPLHVLGQHADMAVKRAETHSLEAVVAGYRSRYTPSSGALVIAGDVTFEQARAVAQETFGGWKSDAPAPATYEPSDWQPRGKRKVFLHTISRQADIVVAQRALAPSDRDYTTLEVLVHVLGDGFGSRLMTALRTDGGVTYGVSARLVPRRDGSTLLIETASARDQTPLAYERIVEELRKLQSSPISPAELVRAQAMLTERELASYETAGSALGAVVRALELGVDPVASVQGHLAALQAVTREQVQAVARRVLTPDKAPVIIVGDLRLLGKLGQWANNDDETF